MLGASPAFDCPPEGASDSDLPGPGPDDLTLSEGDPWSCGDSSAAESSSDMSGELPEPAVLGAVSLVLVPAPERCEACEGCEGG